MEWTMNFTLTFKMMRAIWDRYFEYWSFGVQEILFSKRRMIDWLWTLNTYFLVFLKSHHTRMIEVLSSIALFQNLKNVLWKQTYKFNLNSPIMKFTKLLDIILSMYKKNLLKKIVFLRCYQTKCRKRLFVLQN